jgi:hypothetical protein
MSRGSGHPLDTTLPSSESETEEEYKEEIYIELDTAPETLEEEVIPDVEALEEEAILELVIDVIATSTDLLASQGAAENLTMAGAVPVAASRWLTAGRSDADAAGMAVAVRKEDRHGLSASAIVDRRNESQVILDG